MERRQCWYEDWIRQKWTGSSRDRQLLVNHPPGNLTCWSAGTRLVGARKAQIRSFSLGSQVGSLIVIVVG
ncbi:hypothetical protein NL676_029089 [Syzygium grande]|nr:hypothetical protein NL676_029089 [Syzygium grande]